MQDRQPAHGRPWKLLSPRDLESTEEYLPLIDRLMSDCRWRQHLHRSDQAVVVFLKRQLSQIHAGNNYLSSLLDLRKDLLETWAEKTAAQKEGLEVKKRLLKAFNVKNLRWLVEEHTQTHSNSSATGGSLVDELLRRVDGVLELLLNPVLSQQVEAMFQGGQGGLFGNDVATRQLALELAIKLLSLLK